MNLPALLTELAQLGARVSLRDGDRLTVSFPVPPPSGLRERIVAHKPELIRWLSLREAAQQGIEPAESTEPRCATEAARDDDSFSPSDLQRAFLVGSSEHMEYPACPRHYFELDFEELDPARYEMALNRALRHHQDSLVTVTDDLRLKPLPHLTPVRVPVHDLRGLDAAAMQARLAETRSAMLEHSLPLDRWPWLDHQISLTGESTARLHCNNNTFFGDGPATMGLLEFALRCYADPQWAPPAPTGTFRERLAELAALESSPAGAAARRYWEERLDGLPQPPSVPLRAGFDAHRPSRLERREAVIDADTWQAFRDRAAAHGLTPTNALYAVYAEILAYWGGSRHFALNNMLTRRHRDNTSGAPGPAHGMDDIPPGEVFGNLASLYPLEVDWRGSTAFVDRARALQARVLTDLEHLHWPGTKVLSALNQRRGEPGRAPCPFVVASGLFMGAPRRPVFSRLNTPQTLLDHQFWQLGDDTLWLVWDAVEAAFPDGLLTDLIDGQQRLLELLAGSASAWHQQGFDLLPETQRERRAVLNRRSRPSATATLTDGLAAAPADRPAVHAPAGTLTYSELRSASGAVARRLAAAGLCPGDRAAVLLAAGADQIVAVHGVLAAGGAYVPLDAAWPRPRLRELIAATGARVVVADPADAADLGVPVVSLDGNGSTGVAPTPPQDPDALAYVIHTSGSTGRPKGVAVAHRGPATTIADVNRRYGVTADDVLFAASSLSFDLSVYDIFGAAAAGAALVVPPSCGDPADWLTAMLQHDVTIWNSVPALLELLLDAAVAADVSLPTLRLVLLSGDWIPTSLPARVRHVAPHARVVSLGGATEASIWSIHHPIDDEADPTWPTVPYGQPLANQGWHILHPDGSDAPDWVPGQLYIAGDGLAAGYWDDPAATAASFVPHPRSGERLYRTGDRGRYRPGGIIEFLGRIDRQVKVRGFRIEPAEVEHALAAHPAVRAAAVEARGAGPTRQLIAFVTAHAPTEEIRAYLAAHLPRHLVPDQVIVLPALPLTANGKIDRAALIAPDATTKGRSVHVAPSTPTETALAEIWSEVLGNGPVSVQDDFFALGGQSMAALQIAARITRRFGVPGDVEKLLAGHTVAALAAHIDARSAPCPTALPPDHDEPFPLTELQHAYRVGRSDTLPLGGVAAHFYAEYDWSALDVPLLEETLNQLVARHDALRTVIASDGNQRILPEVDRYIIALEDLSDVPPPEAAQAAAATREALSHQVLAADRWPLFDIRVTRLPTGVSRLHVSVDLLPLDGWSLALLLHEWYARYTDPAYDVPPPETSLRDQILAELRATDTAEHRRARDYWAARLDSLPPAPDLPQRTGTATGPTRFRRRTATFGRQTWEALKLQARERGLTPSAALLAAYATVLARWSAAPRFTVNVTVSTREPKQPDAARLLGPFTTAMLHEIDASRPETFAAFAAAVQRRLGQDLAHRTVSGVTLLRERARREGHAPAPTAPVVFSSALLWGGEEDLASLGPFSRPTFAVGQTPQVWIDHHAAETDGELEIDWDVADAVFPDGVPDAMFAAYTHLLDGLTDPQAWDRTDPVGLPTQMQRARESVTAPASPAPPRTLVAGLLAAAEATPAATAVVTPQRRLNYAELLAESGAIAGWLRRAGLRTGQPVAIIAQTGWEQVVMVYGVLCAGGCYVPVDADAPPMRQRELLALSGARHVLIQPGMGAAVARTGLRMHETHPGGRGEPGPPPSPDDTAYLLFTSGTTGTPKGVLVTHQAAATTIAAVNDLVGLRPDDALLGVSALGFDLSVYDIVGAHMAGAALVLPTHAQRRDPAHWGQLMSEHRVSLWNSVPQLMSMLLEADPPGNPPLRTVLLSGDFVPLDQPDRIRARYPGADMICLGGATEAAIWSTYHRVGDVHPQWTSIPYGRPLPYQSLAVLDSALRPCPDHVTGRIHIGGAGLALGYWQDPELTAARFVTDPRSGERLYDTGDLGRYAPNGEVVITGRADDQVKIRGYRVEPAEVEAVLLRHPDVSGAAVVAAPGATARPSTGAAQGTLGLVAAVISTVDDPQALRGYLAERLPSQLVPSRVVAVEQIPLTVTGKIDRAALVAAVTEDARPTVAPRDAIERLLLTAWERVVGVADFGVTDDFFAVGGDSVQAIRLVNEINAALTFDLEMHELFENVTVEALANLYRSRSAIAPSLIADRYDAALDAWDVLDAVAGLDLAAPHHPGPERSVLLTGGTGWLGAHLLRALLDRGAATIACLVRADNPAAALHRLRDAARHYAIPVTDADLARVVPIVGDLTAENLGLDAAAWRHLAAGTDEIYHLAASTTVTAGYPALRGVNVTPLEPLLRLAAADHMKPLHLTSLTPRKEVGTQETGYSLSKWAAEQVLLTLHERGAPVRIHRCRHALPSGTTGVAKQRDTYASLLRVARAVGAVPDWPDSRVEGVPVDELARSIVEAAAEPALTESTAVVETVDSQPPSVEAVVAALLGSEAAPPERVSLGEWLDRCRAAAASLPGDDAALAGVLLAPRPGGSAAERIFGGARRSPGADVQRREAAPLPDGYWRRVAEQLTEADDG